MNKYTISLLLVVLSVAIALAELAEPEAQAATTLEDVHDLQESSQTGTLTRDKRTLFLKKKLLGAGILGLGLGVGLGALKGYKYGRGGYGGYGGGYGGGYPSYGGGYGGYGNGGYGSGGYGNGGYGYGGYGSGGGGYGGGYGGYGAFKPSLYNKFNSYVNNLQQGNSQAPSYYDNTRPEYYPGYNNNGGSDCNSANDFANDYANSQASWSASGSIGPITGSLSTAGTASAAANAYDNEGYYY